MQNWGGVIKNLFLHNHKANFNQTLQGEIIAKEIKYSKTNENLLLQNQQAKFNQTWYKLSLGKGNSSLCK
jgi:hypothetical protein